MNEQELPVQEVNQQLPTEQQENTSTQEQNKKPKKKRRVWVIILNIIAFSLLIFVAFETVIAFLNFNLIRDNEESKYFVTKSTDSKDGYDYTIYDMGLYRIVRKEDAKNYEIKLLPFFLEY